MILALDLQVVVRRLVRALRALLASTLACFHVAVVDGEQLARVALCLARTGGLSVARSILVLSSLASGALSLLGVASTAVVLPDTATRLIFARARLSFAAATREVRVSRAGRLLDARNVAVCRLLLILPGRTPPAVAVFGR